MESTSSGSGEPRRDEQAEALLRSLLDSLLKDFSDCFNRGEQLLAICPDQVMDPEQRLAMAQRLVEGHKAITATRALLEASPEAMAVSMRTMSAWHQLMTEVWSLSARISQQLN